MTTVEKTDEATLLAQLKHIDHNAQVRMDKLNAQRADIEREGAKLVSERAAIPPAKERYHERGKVAQDELAQLKVQLTKLAHYYELAKGTFEEQAAADDVARMQSQVNEAEKTLERIQQESDEAEYSFANREQEIDMAIQALDTRRQEIHTEFRDIEDIRKKKRDELCEALFTLLTTPYLKSRERLETLQRELLDIQKDYRSECVSKLAGWPQLKQRLHDTILPDTPVYRVLSAELAYLEAIVAERESVASANLNLPAATTVIIGEPKTTTELLTIPEEEFNHTLKGYTQKVNIRINLLKLLINKMDRA